MAVIAAAESAQDLNDFVTRWNTSEGERGWSWYRVGAALYEKYLQWELNGEALKVAQALNDWQPSFRPNFLRLVHAYFLTGDHKKAWQWLNRYRGEEVTYRQPASTSGRHRSRQSIIRKLDREFLFK